MNDENDENWSKEEFLAHIAKKQQRHMDELRAKNPRQYAEVVAWKKSGKGPGFRKLNWIALSMFSGLIAMTWREFLAMFE